MEHYNVQNIGYELIELKDVEIDRIVGNTLHCLGVKTINPKKTRCGIVSVNGKLSRMKEMTWAFDENKILPPVKLKKHQITLYVPPSMRKDGEEKKKITYSILDGRHRVALSIMKNYKKIPAIIF